MCIDYPEAIVQILCKTMHAFVVLLYAWWKSLNHFWWMFSVPSNYLTTLKSFTKINSVNISVWNARTTNCIHIYVWGKITNEYKKIYGIQYKQWKIIKTVVFPLIFNKMYTWYSLILYKYEAEFRTFSFESTKLLFGNIQHSHAYNCNMSSENIKDYSLRYVLYLSPSKNKTDQHAQWIG